MQWHVCCRSNATSSAGEPGARARPAPPERAVLAFATRPSNRADAERHRRPRGRTRTSVARHRGTIGIRRSPGAAVARRADRRPLDRCAGHRDLRRRDRSRNRRARRLRRPQRADGAHPRSRHGCRHDRRHRDAARPVARPTARRPRPRPGAAPGRVRRLGTGPGPRVRRAGRRRTEPRVGPTSISPTRSPRSSVPTCRSRSATTPTSERSPSRASVPAWRPIRWSSSRVRSASAAVSCPAAARSSAPAGSPERSDISPSIPTANGVVADPSAVGRPRSANRALLARAGLHARRWTCRGGRAARTGRRR